ncbi:hypothetical protein C8J57DRAFT_1479312 [Mycena rebaudengoi]|nr:hypothetical protein C8J57DRAFT_1479312 [Mycena rebaudengoi]
MFSLRPKLRVQQETKCQNQAGEEPGLDVKFVQLDVTDFSTHALAGQCWPRPLQLDAAHDTGAHSTVTSPAAEGYTQSPLSPRPSSITYNPTIRAPRPATSRTATGDSFASNTARTSGTAPPTPRGHLARSNSFSWAARDGVWARCRSYPAVAQPVPHVDLLHFIAQKESKRLELRDQLAAHEKELLTPLYLRERVFPPLSYTGKRKWERIVARGFSSPHNASFPASASASATSSFSSLNGNGSSGAGVGAIDDPDAPGTPGTVLDGIPEVGRFIAAAAYEGTRSYGGYGGYSKERLGRPLSASAAGLAGEGEGAHGGSGSGMGTGKAPASSGTTATTASTGTGTTAGSGARLSQSSLASSLELEGEGGWGAKWEGDGEQHTDNADNADAEDAEEDGGGSRAQLSLSAWLVAQTTSRRGRTRARARTGDSSAEAEAEFFFADARSRAGVGMGMGGGGGSSVHRNANGNGTGNANSSGTGNAQRNAQGNGTSGKESGGRRIPGLALVESVAPVSARGRATARTVIRKEQQARAAALFRHCVCAAGRAGADGHRHLGARQVFARAIPLHLTRRRTPRPRRRRRTRRLLTPTLLMSTPASSAKRVFKPATKTLTPTPANANAKPTPANAKPTPTLMLQPKSHAPLAHNKMRATPQAQIPQAKALVNDGEEWNW